MISAKLPVKNTDGLIARWKYFWMSVVALVAILWLYWLGHDTDATRLVIPFFKDIMPQLGLFYIVLSYFVIVGTGNAVNLTDGFRWISDYAYCACCRCVCFNCLGYR